MMRDFDEVTALPARAWTERGVVGLRGSVSGEQDQVAEDFRRWSGGAQVAVRVSAAGLWRVSC
jgi:hypothetical protein